MPVDINGAYNAEALFDQHCESILMDAHRAYVAVELNTVLPIEFVRNNCILTFEYV